MSGGQGAFRALARRRLETGDRRLEPPAKEEVDTPDHQRCAAQSAGKEPAARVHGAHGVIGPPGQLRRNGPTQGHEAPRPLIAAGRQYLASSQEGDKGAGVPPGAGQTAQLEEQVCFAVEVIECFERLSDLLEP